MKAVVCQVSELASGETRQAYVENTPVLLARLGDRFYATAAFCSHQGAPLAQGLLHHEQVICPWHLASFNVISGQLEEPPGLDGLTTYEVQIDGEDVVVEVPEQAPMHQPPPMTTYDPQQDDRRFVILGAGIAGQSAAEMLRQQGFQGQIVMITREQALPYKRTALSKAYLQQGQPDSMPMLRSQDFYQDHGIEVRQGQTVTAVDSSQRCLTFADGSHCTYDQLLVATGGRARQLDVPGKQLDNIYTLRSAEDAHEILETAQASQQVAVIGSSFIGMEAAASLAQAGLSVTVIAPDSIPFEGLLGRALGERVQALHESHGVQFALGRKATQFEGSDAVTAVVLDNGEKIAADLVVVGIGVEPVTNYLQGLQLHEKDHSVVVNSCLQAASHLFAAGDIARFPYAPSGRLVRIEHWRLAAQHGRIAACNMLGQEVPFKGVPFFWTGQFELKLHYVGHADSWDDVVIQGSLEDLEFLALYIEADQIVAAAACGYAQELIAISQLMGLGQLPRASEVNFQTIDWVKRLRQ